MRISAWSSDVCSSDLLIGLFVAGISDRRLIFSSIIVDRRLLGFSRCLGGAKRHGVRDPAQRPLLHLGRGNRFASAEFCCGGRECGLLFARVTSRKLRIELAKDRENLRFADFVEERSEEHTSELQSLMRISYAVFCLKKKTHYTQTDHNNIKQRVIHIHY